MELKLDPRAGFCGGVKRVIRMAEEIISEKGEVLSLGDIIHNHTESERLMKKGMHVVDYEVFDEPEKFRNRTILIRAHGTPESTMKRAEEAGLTLVDGTCPVVTKSQNLVKDYYREGYQIVIIGKAHHPEVIGIQGRCDNKAIVVNKALDLEQIDFSKKTFVLTQTTMPLDLFENLVELMQI